MKYKKIAINAGLFLLGVIASNFVRTKIPGGSKLPTV